MIAFLLTVIFIIVVLYVVNLILGMLTLPPQVKTIVYLIIGLILLVWLLSYLGVVDSTMLLGRPSLRP